MIKPDVRIGLLPLLLFACASGARAQGRYSIRDLGNLGLFAIPKSISENGLVAGVSTPLDEGSKAFYWSGASGMVNVIPPDYGPDPYGAAFGVNDTGQVVGSAAPDQQNSVIHAFLWTAQAGLRDLPTLGGAYGQAQGINSSGQVVGRSLNANGLLRAFVWSEADGIRDLGDLGGPSFGQAINDQGQVAGYANTPTGQTHAFRWSAATGIVDLGTLGGVLSEAFGINNLGHVVGYAATAEGGGNLNTHAFVYNDAGMHDLGTLGGADSQALGINDAGWVVGDSYITTNLPPVHGFVYDGTIMRDLNALIDPASGWSIRSASDINNAGLIVATAVRINEPWAHAVLLTPVPEPAIAGWMLIGTMLVGRRSRLHNSPRR